MTITSPSRWQANVLVDSWPFLLTGRTRLGDCYGVSTPERSQTVINRPETLDPTDFRDSARFQRFYISVFKAALKR